MALVYPNPLVKLDLNKIFFLIVHHVDLKFYPPEDIHKDHITKGRNGAGYNEYIRKDGELVIMRGDHIGAQCEGMNSKSYGIAVEGDYDIETSMPKKQFEKLIERLQYHKNRFPNKVSIEPHSKFVNTNCPGTFFPFEDVLKRMDGDFKFALDVLVKNNIITSPDYWLTNAIPGRTVLGEYARTIITRTANILNKK